MTYYNNPNPLLDSGNIAGYLIGEDNWGNPDITETKGKKVFLRWGNPNKFKKWYSLSFLKFDYFQKIDNSGQCFVGVMVDKLGHTRYRIFKTRISNLIKSKDIITYPAISSESYSDLLWLPQERVFKVFNLSGECSILIPPKWELCNNVSFYESTYDPYSQFKYWPNTDFGHFKDFRFHDNVLFGENNDGTLAIISSKGEIMSHAWSEVQITNNGITFRDKDKNFQKIAFDKIEDYYHKELSEREKQLRVAFQSIQEKSLEQLQDKKVLDASNGDNDSSTTDKKFENICWLYKNFEKQYDNKTVKINKPDRKIVPGELMLCLYQKSDMKTAYIVRYSGRNITYHPIERKFELTDEVTGLRKLKSGRLPKAIQYRPQMTNEELVELFKTITPSLCAQSESEIQDDKRNNMHTEELPTTNIQGNYNQPASELTENDFTEKIRQVYNFLSISFPKNKVFECLMLLFGENIKNYASETDALIGSTKLDLAGEIERKVNENKERFLTSKQLESFNISINYHIKVKEKPYMESLETALKETAGSEELASYIKSIKDNLKREQSEREKEQSDKILKHILGVEDDSTDNTDQTESGNSPIICIKNHNFKIGDIVNEKELLGNKRPKKFIRTGNYLLIFLSDTACTHKGIYEIRGEGEDGNQIIGQNANGDIVNEKKRKIIITKNQDNGFCKIFDEVVCTGKNETVESTNNKDRTVFYFKLKSIAKDQQFNNKRELWKQKS